MNLRSCLGARAMSGFGPDDQARSDSILREAWRQYGFVLLRVDDPDLTWPERMLLRALGERRWGKRAVGLSS